MLHNDHPQIGHQDRIGTAAANVKDAQSHPALPVCIFDLTDTFLSYMIWEIFWFLW